jgi:hypothetical protein
MKKKIVLFSFAFTLFNFLILFNINAMAAPEAKNIREVVDYFYNGQKEGPVLTDSKLCESIKGVKCQDQLKSNNISIGEPVKVWMQFFVPKGALYDDIFIEYKHNGIPRNLQSHKVEGSIRYRIVNTYKPDKIGGWTVTIKRGSKSLKMFNFNVMKK